MNAITKCTMSRY